MSIDVAIQEFRFNGKPKSFFNEINMSLQSSKLNFIIGLSGIGKTTLLNLILGLQKGPLRGSIKFQTDEPNSSFDQLKYLGKIGYQSQNPILLPWLSVEENLLLPYKINEGIGMPNMELMYELLGKLYLDESDLFKYPHELSYGMKSRVCFLRVILYQPKFIFLDELFTGVDTISCDVISHILKEYTVKFKATVLSITHDIDRSLALADNLYIINNLRQLERINKPYDKSTIVTLLKQQI